MFVSETRLVGQGGFGKVMEAELRRICYGAKIERPEKVTRRGKGALSMPFSESLHKTLSLYHRTSSRIFHDLYEYDVRRLEPLFSSLCKDLLQDSRDFSPSKKTFSVICRSKGAVEAGERQVVGTVKNALLEASKELTVDFENPDVVFVVDDVDGKLRIAFADREQGRTGRGYRLTPGDAALRESFAAGLLMMSRWDSRTEVLLDPMCGSGTIPIEAALMAKMTSLRKGQGPALFPDSEPQIFAGDVSPEQITLARANGQRAGIDLSWKVQDFRKWKPRDLPGSGVILCNPPYGKRVGENVRELYEDFFRWVKQFEGYRLAILSGNKELRRTISLSPATKKTLRNGPLAVEFLMYRL